MQFFNVKNWGSLQHYKDRAPPWIKLYNHLLDDYEFACLQDASKLHLVLIWLLASRNSNRLPFNDKWIKQRIGVDSKVDLEELVASGFIEVEPSNGGELQTPGQDASNVLAKSYQDATTEERRGEGETEGETEQSRRSQAIAEEVRIVFDYWISVMKKGPGTKLTPKRKSCIEARLKEKYPIDLIKQAIDNCSHSDHHTGQNDNNTVYDDLTLICRSGEKLEWFANSVGQGKTKEQAYQEDIKRIAEDLNNGGSLFPDDHQGGETFDMEAHSEYEGLPHDPK